MTEARYLGWEETAAALEEEITDVNVEITRSDQRRQDSAANRKMTSDDEWDSLYNLYGPY